MTNTDKLYAVRDAKADCYGAIIVCPNKGLAMRSFMEACEQPNSPMAKYPADFALYELGEYDARAGVVTSHRVPEFVMGASDAVRPAPKMLEEVRS